MNADRVRYAIGGVLLLAGIASLLLSPIPVPYALTYVSIGVVASIFLIANYHFLAYAGAGVLVFGIAYAGNITDKFSPRFSVPW